MEPLDYLKILHRHWKIAAALVATVMLVVFLLSPSRPATLYEATNVLQRQSGSTEGTEAADNPGRVALWTSGSDVPQQVADVLGHTGPVDQLVNRLTVTSDVELGTVELVASASTDEEAVLLVNTFADQTLGYIEQINQQVLAEADQQVENLQAEIQALNDQIAAVGGDTEPEATSLVSEREGLQDQLNQVTTSAEDRTVEWSSLRTASSAKKVAASVGVTRGQSLLLGTLVSLLLAFGVAIMLDRSDSRLHTKEQAERQFGLPVLAEIPLLSLRNRHRAAVYGYENEPAVAEAYRSLRTALLLFRDRLPLEVETAELTRRIQPTPGGPVNTARQVILISSPEAGDGKSSTAANLAMAYAESGQSVLLVNWDLWRPIPARVFGADEVPGVSEFLQAGSASLVHYVHSTSVPGLHLVPAGKLGHQPGAQLEAELRLLEEARGLADVVIIDTAPLLAASVTRELVTMADVVVLVSRAGRTTSPAAERTAELLERLGAPTLGLALVGVPTSMFKNDYYGKPQSRTERLRASVLNREVQGDRDTPRYSVGPPGVRSEPRPGEDEAGGDRAEAPDDLPTRGPKQ